LFFACMDDLHNEGGKHEEEEEEEEPRKFF
jgi:hypothetical protein